MRYINEDFGILKHLVHDGYRANSIEDFLDNIEKIPIPSKWKRLSPLILLAHELFIDHVLVYFRNLNLIHHGSNYVISDNRREIHVEPAKDLFSIPWVYENITGKECSEVVLMYDVNRNKIYLHSFKKVV